MQNVSVKYFFIGMAFASFMWAFAVFTFNFESKTPNYEGLDPRYEIYATAITENVRLYDSENNRTLLWTPGNPKVIVTDVSEISNGKWQVVLEKVY